MAIPKKNKNDINIFSLKEGVRRRDEIYDRFQTKDTFLPKGILHEDLDYGFKTFVEKNLSLTLNGEKIPVLFLSAQAWNEFTKTWEVSDKYGNIKIPFITIVRKPEIIYSETPTIYNIPVERNYSYLNVPIWDEVRKGVDIYTIPQPIPIDLEYDVRFFTYRMRELNRFNQIVLKEVASRQAYTTVNGHYIPLTLESVGDESTIDNLDSKRFFVQVYNFKMLGFLLDENEFQKVPAISRNLIVVEPESYSPKNKKSTD